MCRLHYRSRFKILLRGIERENQALSRLRSGNGACQPFHSYPIFAPQLFLLAQPVQDVAGVGTCVRVIKMVCRQVSLFWPHGPTEIHRYETNLPPEHAHLTFCPSGHNVNTAVLPSLHCPIRGMESEFVTTGTSHGNQSIGIFLKGLEK